jgi:hypothetical protein
MSLPIGSVKALVGGFLLVASLAPETTVAQASLGRPTATFPEDFGAIQTVRELPDGRVLVADPLAKELYLVDLASGRRTVVGAQGQGPREYAQPDAVWPLPGDSTLLVDLGNGRLVALAPNLEFGPTTPISMSDFQPGSPLVVALPQGVDAEGRIYARALGGGIGGGGALPDSADILRIDRGTKASRPAAKFKIQDRTQTTSGGANDRQVAVRPIPLSPEDAWGVAPDGSIAIARARDYHVEWIAPNGTLTRGPTVPFEAVGVGTAEKEEYIAEQGRSGGGVAIQMMVRDGAAQMTMSRGAGAADAREVDQYSWPERKPPFYQGRIPIDPQGRAWVRRHVDAGARSTYDVFDRAGRRVSTLTLDRGKRVIGFGRTSVYVVAYDEFDLNYLERYALPAM